MFQPVLCSRSLLKPPFFRAPSTSQILFLKLCLPLEKCLRFPTSVWKPKKRSLKIIAPVSPHHHNYADLDHMQVYIYVYKHIYMYMCFSGVACSLALHVLSLPTQNTCPLYLSFLYTSFLYTYMRRTERKF